MFELRPRHGLGQGPAMPCTLCTLNSSGAAAFVFALVAALADADGDAVFAGTTMPATCTRLPAHGVMSVAVRRYVPMLVSFEVEPAVPAAAGTALPAAPVAPAVALVAVLPLPAG